MASFIYVELKNTQQSSNKVINGNKVWEFIHTIELGGWELKKLMRSLGEENGYTGDGAVLELCP